MKLIILIAIIYFLNRSFKKRGKRNYRRNRGFMNDMNMNQNQQFMDEMQRQQNQQFMDWSMDESRKSVTPFEHGGYDMNQGNSFNNDNFNNTGGMNGF